MKNFKTVRAEHYSNSSTVPFESQDPVPQSRRHGPVASLHSRPQKTTASEGESTSLLGKCLETEIPPFYNKYGQLQDFGFLIK